MIAVFATGPNKEFGNNNQLPWISCKEDLQRFKRITTNKIILMGSATFQSLPALLPDRTHVVLSSNQLIHCRNGEPPHYRFSGDFKQCIEVIKEDIGSDIAVIGGPSIIEQAILSGEVSKIHITTLSGFDNELQCDLFFDYIHLLQGYRLTDKIITLEASCRVQKNPINLIERVYTKI